MANGSYFEKTNDKSQLHSNYGPAVIKEFGTYRIVSYYQNGKLHRLKGPAEIEYFFEKEDVFNVKHPGIINKEWHLEGIFLRGETIDVNGNLLLKRRSFSNMIVTVDYRSDRVGLFYKNSDEDPFPFGTFDPFELGYNIHLEITDWVKQNGFGTNPSRWSKNQQVLFTLRWK